MNSMYAKQFVMGIEYQMGFYLSRASWAMSSYLKSRLCQHGLREVQVGFIGVLMALDKRDGQRLSELGLAISLEKSTMTGLIDRMERAKLVRRQLNPEDRRAYRVCLTDRGRAVAPELRNLLVKAYQDLTGGMNAGELEMVRRNLIQLIKNSNRLEKRDHPAKTHFRSKLA